jgi:heme/copper-type cytochrome/quinol oxidase subunit 2
MTTRLLRHAFVAMLLLAAPRAALACPVCFGQSDAPMAKAMNMGIMLMLVVVLTVLGGFISFIVTLVRRARLAEMAAERHDPQEGTVQC